MFEGVTAELLNRLLGSYVKHKCFRPDRVSTSVYSGHVKLTELELKQDALDFLNSPFTIRRGFVGKVEFTIPWRRLGSQPVEVLVDGVYIILKPKLELSEEERERRKQAAKQNRLARHEFIKSQNPDRRSLADVTSGDSEDSMPTFSTRLVNKIVDNIELTIRNVHIYYEDHTSIPNTPFSLGLTLESMHMHSTDENWEQCFVDLASLATKRKRSMPPNPAHLVGHKLFEVKSLAVYWNTDLASTGRHLLSERKLEEYYSRCTFQDIEASLGSTIYKRWTDGAEFQDESDSDSNMDDVSVPVERDSRSHEGIHRDRDALSTGDTPKRSKPLSSTPGKNPTGNHYVLMPVDAMLKLISNRDPADDSIPDHDVELSVDRVAFNFESAQYQQMLLLYAALDSFEKTQRYAHLRNRMTESKDLPRAVPSRKYQKLWKFAIDCVVGEVHERLSRWTPEFVTNRRANRLEYMLLWKRNLAGEEGVTSETEKLSFNTPSRIRRQLQESGVGGTPQFQEEFRRGSRLLAGSARRFGTPSTAASGRGGRNSLLDAEVAKSVQDEDSRNVDSGDSNSVFSDSSNSSSSKEQFSGAPVYSELTDEDKKRLESLEKVFSFEDIVYFRALAENELRVERASTGLFHSSKEATRSNVSRKTSHRGTNQRDQQEGSWSNSLLGWVSWTGLVQQSSLHDTSPGDETSGHVLSDEVFLAEQQRLLDILDQDLDDAFVHGQASAPNSNRTTTVIKFCLSRGSLSLFVDQNDLDSKHSKSSNAPSVPGSRRSASSRNFFRNAAVDLNKVLPTYLQMDMSGVGVLPRSIEQVAIMNMSFSGLNVRNTELANGSSAMEVSLNDFEVSDPLRPTSPFSKIVVPKLVDDNQPAQPSSTTRTKSNAKRDTPNFQIWESMLDTPLIAPSILKNSRSPWKNTKKDGNQQQATVTPLFSLNLRTRTSEGRTEVAVTLQVQPLEIMYNAQVIDRVNGFLQPPEALTVFEELQITAINAFSSLRTQTEAKLELAFEKKNTTISLDVHVRAPVLIIPAFDGNGGNNEVSDDEMHCLYVDLGLVTIVDKSNPHPRRRKLFQEQFKEFASTSTSVKSNREIVKDAERSVIDVDESDFFDIYEFSLTDVQITLGPLVRNVNQARRGQSMRLVDPLSLKMIVHVSVLPYDHTMAQIKLFAQLPCVHVHLSPEKLGALYKFAAALIGSAPESQQPPSSLNRLSSGNLLQREGSHAANLVTGNSPSLLGSAHGGLESEHSRIPNNSGSFHGGDSVDALRSRITSPAFGHLSRMRNGPGLGDLPAPPTSTRSVGGMSAGGNMFSYPDSSEGRLPGAHEERRGSLGFATMRKLGSSQSLNERAKTNTTPNMWGTQKRQVASPTARSVAGASVQSSRLDGMAPLSLFPLPTSPRQGPSGEDPPVRRTMGAAVEAALDDESVKRALLDEPDGDDWNDLDLNSFYSLNDDLASVATSKSRRLYMRKMRSLRGGASSRSSLAGDSFRTAARTWSANADVSASQGGFGSALEEDDDIDGESYCTAGQGDWETVVRSVRSGPVGNPGAVRHANLLRSRRRQSPNYKLLLCSFAVDEVRVTLSRTSRVVEAGSTKAAKLEPRGEAMEELQLPPIIVHDDPAKQSSIDNVLSWLQEVRAFQRRKGVASPAAVATGLDLEDSVATSPNLKGRPRLSSETKEEVLNDLLSNSGSGEATQFVDHPVAAFVISNMHLDASLRSLDTSVEFGLDRLMVEDLLGSRTVTAATIGSMNPSGQNNSIREDHGNEQHHNRSHRFIAHSSIEETGFHVPEALRTIGEQRNIDLYSLFSIGHPLTRFEHNKSNHALRQPLLVVRFLAVSPTSDAYSGVGTQLECKTNPVDIVLRQQTITEILDALMVSDSEADESEQLEPLHLDRKNSGATEPEKPSEADDASAASAADILDQFLKQTASDLEEDSVDEHPTRKDMNARNSTALLPQNPEEKQQPKTLLPPEECFSEASVMAGALGMTPVSLMADVRVSSIRIWFMSDCFVSHDDPVPKSNDFFNGPQKYSKLTMIPEKTEREECPMAVLALVGTHVNINDFQGGEIEVEAEMENLQLFSLGCEHGPRGSEGPNVKKHKLNHATHNNGEFEIRAPKQPVQIIGKIQSQNDSPLVAISVRRRVVEDGVVWTSADELVLPEDPEQSLSNEEASPAKTMSEPRDQTDFLFDDVLDLFMQADDGISSPAPSWGPNSRKSHSVWISGRKKLDGSREYSKVSNAYRALHPKSKGNAEQVKESFWVDENLEPPPLDASPLPSLPTMQDIKVYLEGFCIEMDFNFVENFVEHLLEGPLCESLAIRRLVKAGTKPGLQETENKLSSLHDLSPEVTKRTTTSLVRVSVKNTIVDLPASHLGLPVQPQASDAPPRSKENVNVNTGENSAIPSVRMHVESMEFANLIFLDNVGATAALGDRDNSTKNPFVNAADAMNVVERLDVTTKGVSVSIVASTRCAPSSQVRPPIRILDDFDVRVKLARPVGVMRATCSGAMRAQVEFLDEEDPTAESLSDLTGVKPVRRWWWNWSFVPITEASDQVMKVVVASDSPIHVRMAENHIFVVRSVFLDGADTLLRAVNLAQSTLVLMKEDHAMPSTLKRQASVDPSPPKDASWLSPKQKMGASSPLLSRANGQSPRSTAVPGQLPRTPGTLGSSKSFMARSAHMPDLHRRHSTGSSMRESARSLRRESASNMSIESLDSQRDPEAASSASALISLSVEFPELRFEFMELSHLGSAQGPDQALLGRVAQRLFVGPSHELQSKRSPAGSPERATEPLLLFRVVGMRMKARTCPTLENPLALQQTLQLTVGSVEASDVRPSHKRWAFSKLLTKHRNVGASRQTGPRKRNTVPMIECNVVNRTIVLQHANSLAYGQGAGNDHSGGRKSPMGTAPGGEAPARPLRRGESENHSDKPGAGPSRLTAAVTLNQPRVVLLPEYTLARIEYAMRILRLLGLQDGIWEEVQVNRDAQREDTRLLRQLQREIRTDRKPEVNGHLFSPRHPLHDIHRHKHRHLRTSSGVPSGSENVLGTPRMGTPNLRSSSRFSVPDVNPPSQIPTVDGRMVSPVPGGRTAADEAPCPPRNRSPSAGTSSIPPLSIPQQALQSVSHPASIWELSVDVQDVEVWSLQSPRHMDSRAVVLELSLGFTEQQKCLPHLDDPVDFEEGMSGHRRFAGAPTEARSASRWTVSLSRCSLSERSATELLWVFPSLHSRNSASGKSAAVGGWYAGGAQGAEEPTGLPGGGGASPVPPSPNSRALSVLLQPFGASLSNSKLPGSEHPQGETQHNPHGEMQFGLEVEKLVARTTLDELNLLYSVVQNYAGVLGALPAAGGEEEEPRDRPSGRPVALEGSASGSNLAQAGETVPVLVGFNVDGAEWVIVNDAHNFNTPAFNLNLHSFDSTWYLDRRALLVNLQLKLGVEYFNQMVSVNEPCVEPWRVQLEMSIPLLGGDGDHGASSTKDAKASTRRGYQGEAAQPIRPTNALQRFQSAPEMPSRTFSDSKQHAVPKGSIDGGQWDTANTLASASPVKMKSTKESQLESMDSRFSPQNLSMKLNSTPGEETLNPDSGVGPASMSQLSSSLNDKLVPAPNKTWQLSVLSKDILNVNLTESLFETFSSAMNAWRVTRGKTSVTSVRPTREKRKLGSLSTSTQVERELRNSTSIEASLHLKHSETRSANIIAISEEDVPESELSPFRIQNCTGMILRCIAGAQDISTIVPATVTRAVGIRFGGNSKKKVENPSCIALEILPTGSSVGDPSPWVAAEAVELRIDGTATCYQLSPKSSGPSGQPGSDTTPPALSLLCCIQRVGPTRILVVRSTLAIRNRGALPLEFVIPPPANVYPLFLETIRDASSKNLSHPTNNNRPSPVRKGRKMSPLETNTADSRFGVSSDSSQNLSAAENDPGEEVQSSEKTTTHDGKNEEGDSKEAGTFDSKSSTEETDAKDGNGEQHLNVTKSNKEENKHQVSPLWHHIVPAGEVAHVPVIVAGLLYEQSLSIHVRPSAPGGGPEFAFRTLHLPDSSFLSPTAMYRGPGLRGPASGETKPVNSSWPSIASSSSRHYLASDREQYVKTASYRRVLRFGSKRADDSWATFCDVGCRVLSPDDPGIEQALSIAKDGDFSAGAPKLRAGGGGRGPEVKAASAIRVLSFDPTLKLTNLLVHPMTYRLRAETGQQAEGHLPVGACLRWHGASGSTAVSASFRVPGFGWSEHLVLPAAPGARREPGEARKQAEPAQWSTQGATPTGEPGWRLASSSETSRSKTCGVDINDKNKRTLRLYSQIYMHESGMRDAHLYVPYWIVNRSDLPILVRAATRTAGVAARFSGTHIAAGQADEIAAMRRLRMRMHLDDAHTLSSGTSSSSAGLLELLDNEGSTLLGKERSQGDPLMFSYTNERHKKGRIKIRAADSAWSQAIGLDSAGTTGVVEVKQAWRVESAQPRRVYVFGVSIKVGAGKFHRTKIISILPRFVLRNALGRTLRITQAGSHTQGGGLSAAGDASGGKVGLSGNSGPSGEGLFGGLGAGPKPSSLLRPGEQLPFHWQNASQQRELAICFDEFGWGWSGGFVIDNVGDFAVRLKNRHTHAVYILRVEVSLDTAFPGCSILVAFRPELPSLPPYRIQNLSLETLRIGQVGAPPEMHEVLLPYHSCSYTWDDLSLPRQLAVESMGHKAKGKQSVAAPARTGVQRPPLRGASGTRQLMGSLLGLLAPGSWVGLSRALMRGVRGRVSRQLDQFRRGHRGSILLGMYELDRLQRLSPSLALDHIAVGVDADGPTRVLSVVDARIKKNEALNMHPRERRMHKPGLALSRHTDLIPEMAKASIEVDLSLEGIGISVVEDQPRRELVYVSVFGLQMTYSSLETVNRALLKVAHFQVDNQLYNSSFPVMLYPNRPSSAQYQNRVDTVESAIPDGNEAALQRQRLEQPLKTNGNDEQRNKDSHTKTNGNDEQRNKDSHTKTNGNDEQRKDSHTKTKSMKRTITENQKGRSILSLLTWNGLGYSEESRETEDDGYYLGSDNEGGDGEENAKGELSDTKKFLVEDESSLGVVPEDQTGNEQSRHQLDKKHVHFSIKHNESSGARVSSGNSDSKLGKVNATTASPVLKEADMRPVVECCLVSSNRYPSLDFVEYFSVLVLPLDLCLEPELLGCLLNFGTRVASRMDYLEGSVAPPSELSVFRGLGSADSMPSSLRGSSIKSSTPSFPTTMSSQPNAGWNPACPVVLSGDRSTWQGSALQSPFGFFREDQGAEGPDSQAGGSKDQRLRAKRLSNGTGLPGALAESSNAASLDDPGRRSGEGSLADDPKVSMTGPTSRSVSRKLYIEELHIHPVKVTISFRFRNQFPLASYQGGAGAAFIPTGSTSTDQTSSEADGSASGGGSMFRPLRFVLYAMGASLANVDNVPLRLNALVLQHSFATRETFVGQILAHYRLQALRQAYLILGSVDLLGDPLGLVKNLGAGVMDFFYEPALGLVRSPKEFGAGIAKGTLSLFRRTVLATATSVAGVATGTVALLEVLSSDPYTNFRTLTLSDGIVQGLAGVAVAPVKGFDQEGLSGLGKGALVGLLGLFTKPFAGVLRIVQRVFSAVRSTVDPLVKFNPHRVRPPRFLKPWRADQAAPGRLPRERRWGALSRQQLLQVGIISRASMAAAPAQGGSGGLGRGWISGRSGRAAQQVVLQEYSLEHAVGEEVLSRVNKGKYRSDGYVSLLYIGDPALAGEGVAVPAPRPGGGSLATQLSVASFASHWSGSTAAEDPWPGWRRHARTPPARPESRQLPSGPGGREAESHELPAAQRMILLVTGKHALYLEARQQVTDVTWAVRLSDIAIVWIAEAKPSAGRGGPGGDCEDGEPEKNAGGTEHDPGKWIVYFSVFPTQSLLLPDASIPLRAEYRFGVDPSMDSLGFGHQFSCDDRETADECSAVRFRRGDLDAGCRGFRFETYQVPCPSFASASAVLDMLEYRE